MPRWLDTDLLQDTLLVQWHPRLPFLLTATSSGLSLFSSSGERVTTIAFPQTTATLRPMCLAWHGFRQIFACGFSDGSVMIWISGKSHVIPAGSPHTDPINALAWTAGNAALAPETRLVTLDAAGLIWAWQVLLPNFQATKLHEFRSPDPAVTVLDLDTKQHELTLVTLHHLIGIHTLQGTSTILFSVTSSQIVQSIHQYHSGKSWYLILCENGQLSYLSIIDGRVASSQQIKIGIGVQPPSSMVWSLTWVGQSIAAICNGANILRIVDFLGDDSSSISVEGASGGKITTLSFDQIRNRLAAGTDDGQILIWQSKAQYLKEESRIGRVWQLQPALSVNAPLSRLSFHSFYPLLFALREGQLRIFLEHSDVVAFTDTLCTLQTSLTTLQLIPLSLSEEPVTLPAAAFQIQKMAMDSEHIVVWNTKFSQVLRISQREWTAPVPHAAEHMYVHGGRLLQIMPQQIIVCNLQGKCEQTLETMDEANPVLQTALEGAVLAWITKDAQLSLFHLAQDQFLVQRRKLNSAHLLYVSEMVINVTGQCVAMIAKSSESIFSSRVWLYFCSNDTLVPGTENEQPCHLFWDRQDPRILAVECTAMTTSTDEEATCVNTYFVGFHLSPPIQKYTQETLPSSKVLFVRMPHVYYLPAMENKIQRKLTTDFLQLETHVQDPAFVRGMLDFRDALMTGNAEAAFQLIPIKSKQIWMALCHMCIQTGQLDAAVLCLGHAGHAIGCKIVRDVPDDAVEKLGRLAEYCQLADTAQTLYTQHGRWDLLARYQARAGQWDTALATVREHDRVHLKRMHFEQGQYLEKLGHHDAAIRAYEQSDALLRIPQLLLASPAELERYLETSKCTAHAQWYAQYKESKGRIEEAIPWYIKSKDILSAVRLYCYLGQMREARELADTAQHPGANYFLAQHYEKQAKIKDAVAHYAKAQCFTHAVRLAKQHRLMDDLMHLALRCRPHVQLEVARFYIEAEHPSMAIPLLLRAGEAKQALEVACEHNMFDKMVEIARAVENDPVLLRSTAELLALHHQYAQAVDLLVLSKAYPEALSLCVEKNVPVTDAWAAAMPPALVAEACMAQHQYALASKKYTLAGDKLNAMKALIQLGDIDQILYFAGMTGVKNKDIFILAANYLQSRNWREDPVLLKHIITFYTKAKAFDHLSRFFETCAQVEVDEYSHYEKALGALKEAHKCASQSAPPKNEGRILLLDRKIELVTQFTKAQHASSKNAIDETLQICASLLNDPDVEIAVRVGDVYALLIATYLETNMITEAQQIFQRMKGAVPLRQIPYFLEEPLLMKVEPHFYSVQSQTDHDADIVEEEEHL